MTCFSALLAQTSLPLAARLGVAFLAVDSGAITISSGFPPSSSMPWQRQWVQNPQTGASVATLVANASAYEARAPCVVLATGLVRSVSPGWQATATGLTLHYQKVISPSLPCQVMHLPSHRAGELTFLRRSDSTLLTPVVSRFRFFSSALRSITRSSDSLRTSALSQTTTPADGSAIVMITPQNSIRL